MNLPDYSYEFCLTEPSSGDTQLFIENYLSHKLRKEPNIYKSSELESPFIEISNHKRNDTVVRCICKQPNMTLYEFYLNDLLDNLSKENEPVFLLGDFNINLLNCGQDTSTDEFLDFLSSHLFLAHVFQPIKMRVTPKLLYIIVLHIQYLSILYLEISRHLSQITCHNQNLTYMKENGPNLTKKTLLQTIFQWTWSRHYAQIVIILINPLKFS